MFFLCYIRPGQQSKQTPGQFLYRSLQEQVTGAQEHAGQTGQLGDRGNHLQHDKMLWMLQTTAMCDFLRIIIRPVRLRLTIKLLSISLAITHVILYFLRTQRDVHIFL